MLANKHMQRRDQEGGAAAQEEWKREAIPEAELRLRRRRHRQCCTPRLSPARTRLLSLRYFWPPKSLAISPAPLLLHQAGEAAE